MRKFSTPCRVTVCKTTIFLNFDCEVTWLQMHKLIVITEKRKETGQFYDIYRITWKWVSNAIWWKWWITTPHLGIYMRHFKTIQSSISHHCIKSWVFINSSTVCTDTIFVGFLCVFVCIIQNGSVEIKC